MKKITCSLLLMCLCCYGYAQTNVSGGIFSNTTWTLANSPYIVVDTVVVFPGVTLTIEPGVTVKFHADIEIEIRQARLVALGTATDSITFTSNSATPTPGIYSGIYLNGGALTSTFNYCKFSYAAMGINAAISDSGIINNSYFNQNLTGVQFLGGAAGVIDSSVFDNNTNAGMKLQGMLSAKINYCDFTNNAANGLILEDASSSSMFPKMSYCNFSNNGSGLVFGLYSSLINHCGFSNNTNGLLEDASNLSQFNPFNNTIKNCNFDLNQTGLKLCWHIFIDSCSVTNNQTGISGNVNKIKNCTIDSNSVVGIVAVYDSIINCNIRYNGAGINTGLNSWIIGNDIEHNIGTNVNAGSNTLITGNTIRYGSTGIDVSGGNFVITQNTIDNNNLGINLNSSTGTLSCNRICNNTTYDLQYGAVSNFDASHNYWCTADSASTEVVIYDGYDNINYGLISFMPFDSLCVPATTAINEIENTPIGFIIYPNPATSTIQLTFNTKHNAPLMCEIINVMGERVYEKEITNSKLQFSNSLTLDVSFLAKGMYVVRVGDGTAFEIKKLIIE